jgi:hypothetical protein
MFRKRAKKQFPPGTFIPTPARIAAIIQLCLAFSLLLWIISQPFMGDLYTIRSRMLLFDSILGQSEYNENSQRERNSERFTALPEAQKQLVLKKYDALKKELQLPFMVKLRRAAELLLFHTPSWELAWLLFSIIIPILLLKRMDGAVPACWLLVAITIGYGIDNRLNAVTPSNAELQLFPTEELLQRQYYAEPVSSDISKQQKQLLFAWQLYLVDKWADEKASEDPQLLKLQIENGEFVFNIARIEKMEPLNRVLSKDAEPQRLSLGTLGLYIFWNLFFALTASRSAATLRNTY